MGQQIKRLVVARDLADSSVAHASEARLIKSPPAISPVVVAHEVSHSIGP